MPTDRPWVLHMISHTHWDREWYMGFEQYRWRLVKLMDRLLALFDEKPAFRAFLMDGQVSALKDYLEIRPEREGDVRRAVEAGRLQIGPWFTQPHETLASGEAIVRNLLLGIRESRRLGGAMMISYNADQFGHVAQMPQLLQGFGIDDVVAWRGMPQGTKNVFRWQGADGSSVHMWYQNATYGNAMALPPRLDDSTIRLDGGDVPCVGLRTRVQDILNSGGPIATTEHLLCMNGVDHSFAQENLPEVVDAINTHIPGVRAVQSTLPEYLAAVKHAHAEAAAPFTSLTGELFEPSDSVLPDVHSTHPDQKRANSLTEDAMERWAEPFAAFTWLTGCYPYPEAQLARAWEYLLLNHAHDSLGCSSHDVVYRAVMHRYDCANEIIQAAIRQSLQSLCNIIAPEAIEPATAAMVLFNPLGWARDEVVNATIDVPHALGISSPALFDDAGERPLVIHGWEDGTSLRFNPFRGHPHIYPIRRYRVSFHPGEIPALGYKRLCLGSAEAAAPTASPLLPAPNVLENERLRVTIHRNGTFDLLHKVDGVCYAGLHLFEDGGEAGDGFTHVAPQRDEVISSQDATAEIRVVSSTPLQATVEIRLTMSLPAGLADGRTCRSEERAECTIASRLTLAAGSGRLDVETVITNQARDHRLRVLFPAGLAAGQLRVAQPFDVVARAIVPEDKAAHGQQLFLDVHDGQKGLLIANVGIYEYTLVHDVARGGPAVALTLLRATDCIYGCFSGVADLRIPQAQCLGEYRFSYSLVPHAADWQAAMAQAYDFRFPMQLILRRELEEQTIPGFVPPAVDSRFGQSGSFLQITPSSLQVSAIKRQDERNTLIVRLQNHADTAVEGQLRLTIPGCVVTHAYLVNLLEQRGDAIELDAGQRVSLTAPAKGIITLELCGEFPPSGPA